MCLFLFKVELMFLNAYAESIHVFQAHGFDTLISMYPVDPKTVCQIPTAVVYVSELDKSP